MKKIFWKQIVSIGMIFIFLGCNEGKQDKNVEVEEITQDNDSVLLSKLYVGEPYKIIISKDAKKAYVAGSDSVEIVDISNPSNIKLEKRLYEKSTYNLKLSKDNKIAYLVNSIGLVVIDIHSLEQGILPLSTGAYDVVLSEDENMAYVADFTNGLEIIDVTRKNKPILVSNLDINGTAMAIVRSEDNSKLYISGENGLKIIDIVDKYNPKIIGYFYSRQTVSSLVISSDEKKLYLADGFEGLKILDIQNPITPKLIGSINLNGDVESIKLSKDGKRVYLSTGFNGVHIIDISNPKKLVILQKIDMNDYNKNRVENYVEDIALSFDEESLFVLLFNEKMNVIDIRKKNSVRELLDSQWLDDECRYTNLYDNYGNITRTSFHKIIYAFNGKSIYQIYHKYSDENCELLTDEKKYQSEIKYYELGTVKNLVDKRLHGIRIQFTNSFNRHGELLQHDGYYVLDNDEICFSKSIFVKNKVIPLYINEGTQIGEQTLNGFGIIENESDEIDYEYCLGRID